MVECGRPISSPKIRSEIPRSRATSCHVLGVVPLATSRSMTCRLATCHLVVNRLGNTCGTTEPPTLVRTQRGMADKEAGQRLAKVLRVAMTQAGIDTWRLLGLESGVSPTTIDNWIYGVTTPRAHHLAKVAKRLHPYTSASALELAYLGLPAEEPPLIEVLREIAPDLHELVALLRAQADEAVVAALRTALEERRQRRFGEHEAPTDTPDDETPP